MELVQPFLGSIVGGLIASVFGGLTAWFAQRWLQRKGYVRVEPEVVHLEHKEVPTDLLHYVRPGVSVAHMREQLGAPFSIGTHGTAEHSGAAAYRYKFANLNLEAFSEDGDTIHTMTLVLPSVKAPDHFEVPMLDPVMEFVMGRDRMRKVLEEGDDPDWSTSSKHGWLRVEKYYGNPAQYREFKFGVFNGPSATYDADTGDKSYFELDSEKLKVNYLTITAENYSLDEGRHYDFYAFR